MVHPCKRDSIWNRTRLTSVVKALRVIPSFRTMNSCSERKLLDTWLLASGTTDSSLGNSSMWLGHDGGMSLVRFRNLYIPFHGGL